MMEPSLLRGGSDQTRRPQLPELKKKAYKAKNNTFRYVLFQELADVSAAGGEYLDACRFYGEARKVAQKMNNLKLECDTLIDLASTSDNLDMTADAVAYYTEALGIAQKMRNFRVESRILGRLGLLYARARNFDLAAERLTQAAEAGRMARGERVATAPWGWKDILFSFLIALGIVLFIIGALQGWAAPWYITGIVIGVIGLVGVLW